MHRIANSRERGEIMWDWEEYFRSGYWIGWAVGIVTFIGCYIYCIATYGFLFGVGLGWLPSAIVAVVVGGAMMFLWGLVLFLLVIVLVWVVWVMK
jgi:hypothetical protein